MRLDLTDRDTVELRCDRVDLDLCKSIPGGKWRTKAQCWEYPASCLLDIREAFKGRTATVGPGIKDYLHSQEIRQSLLDGVKQGVVDLDAHPFLMEHQKKCVLLAKYFNRFSFFLDTGTGKTITALQIIEDKATKFLVVCPKAIIKAAWVEDAAQFFPEMQVLPISRNMNKENYGRLFEKWCRREPPRKASTLFLKGALEEMAQVYIINPESFKLDVKAISSLGVRGLILDESTMIKNPDSQITTALTAFAETMEYVYILSGKPAPNSSMDYFSQMRMVDPGILGDSYYSFRMRYYLATGYMQHIWLPKPGAEDDITRRISKRAFFISKEECLDLPEKTYLIRSPEMPKAAMKYYKQMEHERVLRLEDTTITAANKLSTLMKLRQITSGFVLDSEGDDTVLHSAKIQELVDTLDQIGDKQVIIWAQFQAEIRLIEKTLTDMGKTCVTAYGGTKSVDQSIVDFKDGAAQYIICHPMTLRFGVTLTNCTYVIYYSMSYSYEDYYQSHDRVYRKGQSKPCTFIFLLMQGTIDEVIYEVIQNKGTASDIIEEMIRKG